MVKNKPGFTIIEVVLVLAIAGLIFLMVFIALPALQRSQRDTQRRNDMARVATALTQYQANNGGELPYTRGSVGKYNPENGTGIDNCGGVSAANRKACTFIRDYMNAAGATTSEFKDPNGSQYGVLFTSLLSDGTVPTNTAWSTIKLEGDSTNGYSLSKHNFSVFLVARGAECNGEKIETTGDRDKTYAIMYRLEGSGVYCSDNS